MDDIVSIIRCNKYQTNEIHQSNTIKRTKIEREAGHTGVNENYEGLKRLYYYRNLKKIYKYINI